MDLHFFDDDFLAGGSEAAGEAGFGSPVRRASTCAARKAARARPGGQAYSGERACWDILAELGAMVNLLLVLCD